MGWEQSNDWPQCSKDDRANLIAGNTAPGWCLMPCPLGNQRFSVFSVLISIIPFYGGHRTSSFEVGVITQNKACVPCNEVWPFTNSGM